MKFSIYVCYGDNSGRCFIEWKRRIKRLVLWKFAIGFMDRDIEVFGMDLLEKITRKK